MVVDLAQGRVTTGAEVDRFVGIEALELGNRVDLVYANKAGFGVDLSDGNDRLIGMAGSSMYIGGDSNDTLDLSQFKTPVAVFLDAFSMRVGLNSAQVREFETVLGALVSANMIYSGAENNLFRGGAFADELHGGFGVNTLYGANGNDRLIGGDSMDSLYGGVGNDLLRGGGYRDTLDGSFGDDQLFGGDCDDMLFGGAGNDYILTSASNEGPRSRFGMDEAYGGDGNNRLVAQCYDFVRIYGGSGNDTLILNGFGRVTLEAGLNGFEKVIFATDEYQVVSMKISNYRLDLGAGDDQVTLTGASNYNLVNVGAGNNTVNLMSGHHDTFFAGTGADHIALMGTSGAGSVIDSGAGNDLWISIRRSIISAVWAEILCRSRRRSRRMRRELASLFRGIPWAI